MHQRQWVAHRPAYSCSPRCCSGSAPPAASLPQVCPAIEELVTQLEGCWRSVLPEDQFGLYELDEASVLLLYCSTGTVVAHCTFTAAWRPPRCRNAPGSPLFPCFPLFPCPSTKTCTAPCTPYRAPYCLQRFKYLDSLDPGGKDPFAFRSIRDPAKGQPGFPRLQVGAVLCWPSDGAAALAAAGAAACWESAGVLEMPDGALVRFTLWMPWLPACRLRTEPTGAAPSASCTSRWRHGRTACRWVQCNCCSSC